MARHVSAAKEEAAPLGRKPARPLRVLGVAEASTEAVKTGRSVDAKSIVVMPIANLVGYDNPRHEPANCYEKGYALFGDPRVEAPRFDRAGRCVQFVSLAHLLLSDNVQQAEFAVKLVLDNESVDRAAAPDAAQTIPELGEEIRHFGQWVPVSVKQTQHGVVLGDGGRRVCGILLEHAKDRVKILRGDPDAPAAPFPAVVQATDLDCTEDDLFLVSAKINLARKGFSELQEGRVYHEMLRRVNPATRRGGPLFSTKFPKGRVYTKKEAAAELRVHYSTFRNREALWHEYRALERDAKGNVVRRSGLTADERRQVQQGTLLPTYASRLSLGESTRGVSRNGGQRVQTKQRALTLREMEALFDATPAHRQERRQAIAECMRKDFADALRESRTRMDEQMDQVERDRGIGRPPRNRGKGRAA